MATPYVPGDKVAQVEVIGEALTIPVENTLYFQCANVITQGKLQALVDEIAVRWASSWAAYYPLALVVREVYGTDLTTQTGPTADAQDAVPFPGGLNQAIAPLQNTLSISFRTGNRGRSGRGRNYHLALSMNQIAGNNVLAAEAAGIKGCYEDLVGTNTILGEWTWGVFSRRHNKTWRTQGLFQPIVSVVIPTTRVASQDGRMK